MNISVIDGSNYFKGLLLLIRKDRKVTGEEHEMMAHIGKNLGFDEMFIEDAIQEILRNRFITTIPPVFSTQQIAKKFLTDGFILAASDDGIHSDEDAWLCSVAERNGIGREWLLKEKESVLQLKKRDRHLESDNIKIII